MVSLQALNPHLGLLHQRGLLAAAVMWLVHRRIGEVCVRMARLVARFRAGTLRTVLPVRVVGTRAVRAGVVRAARVWPCTFGWLGALGGWKIAAVRCWIEAILETPEMRELLVAAPQARRMLLPFCRALAVPVHLLRPGRFPAPPVVRVPVKRVRKPSPKMDWGRTKIPRGVVTWIRKERRMERARAAVARFRKEQEG